MTKQRKTAKEWAKGVVRRIEERFLLRFHMSLILLAMIGAGFGTTWLLHRVGLAFGGQGELADVLAVMIWLQVVSLVLAVVLFVIGLILPLVGGLMMLAAFFWGLWATLALIAAAHRFDGLLKAAGVCVLTVVTFSIGMTILSAVLGGLGVTGR